MSDPHSLTKAYKLIGKFSNSSPLVMGAGEGIDTDKAISKDDKGNPYISSSAFVGALKSSLDRKYNKAILTDPKNYSRFWGSKTSKIQSANESQSHFRVMPMYATDVIDKVEILDGIRMEHHTGIVKKQGKYDYEAINHVVDFEFQAEIYLRANWSEIDFELIIQQIVVELNSNQFAVGAYTASGFGRLNFRELSVYKYCFPEDALRWWTENDTTKYNLPPRETNPNNLSLEIKTVFQIKTALISGFSRKESSSDKSHYHFNGKPALTGKSIRGAVIHRMWRIINTIHPSLSDIQKMELLNLFGWGYEEKEKLPDLPYKSRRSRLDINFVEIENTSPHYQDRIKIDRFTGGTIDGAKFDSEPIRDIDKSSELTITFKIEDKPQGWELGLLLMVVKDLWNSDLAIGGEKNIGRGVLKGKVSNIKYNGENYVIDENGVCEKFKDLNQSYSSLISFSCPINSTTAKETN